MPYQALRNAVLVSSLVLFCLLPLALAEKRTSDSKQPTPGHPSDRLIAISLTMYDNRKITVSQYDGEMITTGPKEGKLLGITPRLSDTGLVVLEFSSITKIVKKGAVIGGSVASLGTMDLNSGVSQAAPINLISSVQLIGVSEDSAVRIQTRPTCPCCVTCGGHETCGVNVVVDCGSPPILTEQRSLVFSSTFWLTIEKKVASWGAFYPVAPEYCLSLAK